MPVKAKPVKYVGKVMCITFFTSQGVLLIHLVPTDTTLCSHTLKSTYSQSINLLRVTICSVISMLLKDQDFADKISYTYGT